MFTKKIIVPLSKSNWNIFEASLLTQFGYRNIIYNSILVLIFTSIAQESLEIWRIMVEYVLLDTIKSDFSYNAAMQKILTF